MKQILARVLAAFALAALVGCYSTGGGGWMGRGPSGASPTSSGDIIDSNPSANAPGSR